MRTLDRLGRRLLCGLVASVIVLLPAHADAIGFTLASTPPDMPNPWIVKAGDTISWRHTAGYGFENDTPGAQYHVTATIDRLGQNDFPYVLLNPPNQTPIEIDFLVGADGRSNLYLRDMFYEVPIPVTAVPGDYSTSIAMYFDGPTGVSSSGSIINIRVIVPEPIALPALAGLAIMSRRRR
jgi:hypothetical protein